jgi:hypothetical protein
MFSVPYRVAHSCHVTGRTILCDGRRFDSDSYLTACIDLVP